jgi:hypothetical protein
LASKRPSGVRRGHTFAPSNSSNDGPVGCSGSAYQKPVPCELAATLPISTLSGLVIQNAAGPRWCRSEASRAVSYAGRRTINATLRYNTLPRSTPSSMKKQ